MDESVPSQPPTATALTSVQDEESLVLSPVKTTRIDSRLLPPGEGEPALNSTRFIYNRLQATKDEREQLQDELSEINQQLRNADTFKENVSKKERIFTELPDVENVSIKKTRTVYDKSLSGKKVPVLEDFEPKPSIDIKLEPPYISSLETITPPPNSHFLFTQLRDLGIL